MEVIKAVDESGSKLVSTFAHGRWRKEYAQGIETIPDVGYLFAYSRRNIRGARRDTRHSQFWLAEADVVGRIGQNDISMSANYWHTFWKGIKLQLRMRGSEYLLCSSITLVRRIK